uniref:ATP binding protein n=1 Tax=Rhizophora mucronata TaxID=61149 RepID=A0A2P2J285_RHIMU
MQLRGHQAEPHQTQGAVGLTPRHSSSVLKLWKVCLNLVQDYCKKKDMKNLECY